MALRVGVDMDGTLADLSSAYHEVERVLFPDRPPVSDEAEIEQGEQEQASDGARALQSARHEALQRDQIWEAIRRTEDFWLGLRPIEDGVVRRLHEVSTARGWEVFFITQRPVTAGQTVQRQTQQWLVREGFDSPSVLTLRGSRGRAAAALELDVLIDDYAKNCVDVVSESQCRPLLVLRTPSASSEAAAGKLGIGVIRSVAEALAVLESPEPTSRPGFLERLLGRSPFRR